MLHIAQCMNNMCHHILSLLKLSVVSGIIIISPILIAQDFLHWISEFQWLSKEDFFLEGTPKKKVPLFLKNKKMKYCLWFLILF